MAATKEQLRDRARELSIDVDALPQDGQGGPSKRTLEDAIAAVTGEVPVDQGTFVVQEGQPTLNVPLAGLLASDPSLRDRELKPSEWRQLLDEYLNSERH